METYFKIRTFVDFGLPLILLVLCALIFLSCFIWGALSSRREDRIKKYMLANGYEYYLRNAAFTGDKMTWAYCKGDVSIDEDILYKMLFWEIKRKYK